MSKYMIAHDTQDIFTTQPEVTQQAPKKAVACAAAWENQEVLS